MDKAAGVFSKGSSSSEDTKKSDADTKDDDVLNTPEHNIGRFFH